MAKKRTLHELQDQRAYVIREFACGHIKSRQAIRLKKQYDEKILQAQREMRKTGVE